MFAFRLIILVIISCSMAHAQPYRNLIFEGAGIRGIAYVGALKELENQNILSGIENVGGTSAGAIAALCVALGYSSEETEKIIYATKLQQFNDGKFFFIGGLIRTTHSYGWYRGKAFTKWLEKIIEAKTNNSDITFSELHTKGFRDLHVTGTSLNQQKLIVFSRENYPEMKVKDAVRISMSIPLYFEPVFISSDGKVLPKRRVSEPFDIMVDGGITGNFPIFIFDSVDNKSHESTRIPNAATLGFRIDTPTQILFDKENKGLAPVPVTRFNSYVGACYNYVIENLNRNDLTSADWERTISISSGNIGPKVKRLSPGEKHLLITNGQLAAQKFLALHN